MQDRFQIERSLKRAEHIVNKPLYSKYQVLKDRLFTQEYSHWATAFPGGNDHGPEHIERVLEKLDQLIAGKPQPLGPYELFLTMMSILYHDIGLLHGRAGHADFSGLLVGEEHNDYLVDVHDRDIISAAVVSHSSSKDIAEEMARFATEELIGGQRIRPRLIAALVRLADELDEDFRRADPILQERMNLPEESQFFWQFCQRVRGIWPDRNSHTINVDLKLTEQDVGRNVPVNGRTVPFIVAVGDKIAKINIERIKMNNFLPETLRYHYLKLSVKPLPGHEDWKEPRDFLFGNATSSKDFVAAFPEFLADTRAGGSKTGEGWRLDGEAGETQPEQMADFSRRQTLLSASGSAPYVRRPALERQLHDLLDSHKPFVAVTGPPSVGKRTLVAQVLKDRIAPSCILRISADSQENAQRTMFDALVASGRPPREISVIPQYDLKELLSSEHSPEVLVIENASSAELPRFFASGGVRAAVIVTTTRRLHGIEPNCSVKVGELEQDEAVELVSQLLPAATRDDAEMLARSLDCHVLAITTACGMIRESTGMSVSGFCRGLRQDMAAVFDGDDDSQYPALTQIYRKTLADLERLDPQACRLLELAAFLYDADAFSAFLVFALGSALNVSLDNELHLKMIAERAAKTLHDRYLIEVNHRSCITMPRLARTIITHLLHDRGQDICRHLRQGILCIVALSRKAWPDMPLDRFLESHRPTLLHLMNTHIDPLKAGTPVGYMQVYAQGLADLLKRIDEPAWRAMIIAVETSEGSFTMVLQVLPRELENVARPAVSFSWRDSEEHCIEYAIPDWETRKAMQMLLISSSDSAIQDVRPAPADGT